MADILEDILKRSIFYENVCILIKIAQTFISESMTDNDSASIDAMAWHRTGDKSLPGPMLTQFINECMSPGFDTLTPFFSTDATHKALFY